MGCPCVVYSKNRQRLRSLQNQGRPLVGGGERYDKQCCIYCALSFSGFCWAIKMQVCRDVDKMYSHMTVPR
jgi:hypothetical protein